MTFEFHKYHALGNDYLVIIFSKYLIDTGYVTTRSFEIETSGGVVRVELMDETANLIKVDMGTVTFRSDRIPVSSPVGNVHGRFYAEDS
jgi:diaminopimelate epimerase